MARIRSAAGLAWQRFVSSCSSHLVAFLVTLGTLLVAAFFGLFSGWTLEWLAFAPACVMVMSTAVQWALAKRAPWPSWLVAASIAAPTLIVLTGTLRPRSSSLPLTCLLLVRLLLPWVLRQAVGIEARIPSVGVTLARRLPEPALYFIVIATWLACSAFIVLPRFEALATRLAFGSVGVAAFALASVRRASLWSDAKDSFSQGTLPHIPAWLCGLVPLLLWTPTSEDLLFVIPPVLLLAFVHGASQLLRRSPVEPLTDLDPTRPDSIQSKVEHYVDVQGRSRRLAASIARSDAGVFGITGVRGAGKSALTRHALSTFAHRHFVLEIAAPVQNDAHLGFFVSVCRAVCGKILTDLQPILRGPIGGGRLLWDKFRKPTIVVLAACVMLLISTLAMDYARTADVQERPATQVLGGPWSMIDDPLYGRVEAYKAAAVIIERQVVEALIRQIDAISSVARPAEAPTVTTQHYLLVPASAPPARLLLLRVTPGADVAGALSSYRSSLNWQDQADEWARRSSLWKELGPIPTTFLDKARESLQKHSRIGAELRYLSQELAYHLRSPTKISDQSTLATSLVLEAFADLDPKLIFDVSRLHQFREVLQVYRRLLDGDIVPALAEGKKTEPRPVSMSARLLDVSFPPVALLWMALFGILVLSAGSVFVQMLSDLARAMVNRRYLNLYAEAEDFMQQLTYNLNREMSAGLSWQGVSVGGKQTLSARDLTLPGLTSRYTRFLSQVRGVYNGKVIIAIDELDKIHDPEQVRGLLTEIKGALFAKGTFYVISISEDAARSFRLRLASGRDIFESTFDEVVEVRQMDVPAAVVMLEQLEASVPTSERLAPETLRVAALFGGGIPREIIRARRTLSFEKAEPQAATPPWAARILLREELENWAEHLAETSLSGEDTIKVRGFARVAIQGVAQGSVAELLPSEVWASLEKCVDIIDPTRLRHSVGYTDNSTSSPGADPLQQGYRRLKSDLQTILRLLILVHLTELISRSGELTATHDAILECHRALADKPALAENLLLELRAKHLPSPDEDVFTEPYVAM